MSGMSPRSIGPCSKHPRGTAVQCKWQTRHAAISVPLIPINFLASEYSYFLYFLTRFVFRMGGSLSVFIKGSPFGGCDAV